MSKYCVTSEGMATLLCRSLTPSAPEALADALRDLVARMQCERLTARRDPVNIDRVTLVRRTASGSLRAGHVPRALVEEALARGLLTPKGAAQFVLAPLPPAPPRAGHAEGSVRPEPRPQRGPEAESPSLWLHRRKGS
jgi:hypothetical protein